MNRKIVAIGFLLICYTFTALAQSASLVSQSNYAIFGTKPTEAFTVLLKIEGASPGAFQPVGSIPAAVKYNNSTNDTYKKAFSITYDPKTVSLLITADLSMIPNQGIYELSVPYQIGNKLPDLSTQSKYLIINVDRPGAVIESVNTLTIITDNDGTITSQPLVLRETARKSTPTDLSFEAPNIPHQQKYHKLVKVAPNCKQIGAGQILQFPYIVDPFAASNMPLGKTTFTLYVNSNLTSGPLPVSFEFDRSLSKNYIILMVFIGLLFGFAMRHILQSKLDNTAARILGLQLLNDMKNFADQTKDEGIKNTLDGYSDEVRQAINKIGSIFNVDPSGPTATIKSYQSKFDQLQQDFRDKLQSQIINVMNAKEALYDPGIPENLLPYLQSARASLEAARIAIDDDKNPTSAKGAITDLTTNLNSGITDYKNYITSLFSYLALAQNLPQDATGTLGWLTQQNTNFQTLETGITINNQDFKTALLNFKNTQNELTKLPANLQEQVMLDYKGKKPNAAENTSLVLALGNWIAVIQKMVDNNESESNAAIYNPGPTLATLNSVWIQAQSSNAPVAAPETSGFESLVESRQLLPYINEIHESSSVFPIFSFREVTPSTNLPEAINNSQNSYILFNILQLIILTLLIGLGAYNSYYASFVGTTDQFITIFIVAFSLDITIGNVSQFKAKSTL